MRAELRLAALVLALGATAAALSAFTLAARHSAQAAAPPRVQLLDGPALTQARDGQPDADQAQAVSQLRQAADAALQQAPLAVTAKTANPPSGDKHDYMTLSVYWWPGPDPAQPLPYVQHDGQRNPEANGAGYDARSRIRLASTVDTLALAYYLTADERYAQKASQLIHAWFLDPASRMNPNMRFSQLIPGRDQERGTGIIDGRDFLRVIDDAALIEGSASWTAQDEQALQGWFGELAGWLADSHQGQLESAAKNNHGNWFDAQLAGFGLYAGRSDLVQKAAADTQRRLVTQIEPDGQQPLELARTRSFHYSLFSLEALADVATLAGQAGAADVWSYQTADGRGIRRALDFLVPYASGAQRWPHQEIGDSVNSPAEIAPLLHHAAAAYPEGGYGPLLDRLAAQLTPLQRLRLRLGYWQLG